MFWLSLTPWKGYSQTILTPARYNFKKDDENGTAWDLPHVINGRCKELPDYKNFIKEYKEARTEVKDWADVAPLMDMCKAYVDYVTAK